MCHLYAKWLSSFLLPLLNLFSCAHLNLNVTVTFCFVPFFPFCLTILPFISLKNEEKNDLSHFLYLYSPKTVPYFFPSNPKAFHVFFYLYFVFMNNWRIKRLTKIFTTSWIYFRNRTHLKLLINLNPFIYLHSMSVLIILNLTLEASIVKRKNTCVTR